MGSETVGGEGAPTSLGALLRRFRDRAMLSQQALAERSGLSPRTVRALEIGQVRRPHAESIRLLATALDLGPADREALVRSARRPPRAATSGGSGDESPTPAVPQPRRHDDAPAELPPGLADFTGRQRELARLDETLAARRGHPAVRIALVVGPAGVGKTALAVQWAHRVRGAFPDGQLYVDLRGFAPGPPLAPLDALARMLRSLGVEPDRIPVDPEEAAGLFRTLLAGKRALVLLDNAGDAEQIRPLLPADPACCALVTSRDSMAGLVATHGAHRVALDVLGARESVDLLARVVGDGRVSTEPEAAHRLARACGHLPLALRVAAANLTTRPGQDLAGYATALDAEGRLTGLGVDGDPQVGVRAAFDLSYERLDEPLRRLFRLLSLAPGADITLPAAVALTGDPVPTVARRLDRLVAAHLLQASGAGRYGYHDLLREYAQEQAESTDPAPERAAAGTRLFEWYLHTAYAAGDVLYGKVLRLPLPPSSAPPRPLAFDGYGPAAAWLDAERHNLLATIRHGAGSEDRSISWHLADALRGYFWMRPDGVEWLAATDAGLVAAEAGGDRRAQSAVLLSMGECHMLLGNYARAAEHLESATTLAQDVGWLEGFSSAMNSLAGVTAHLGRPAEAVGCFERSLAADEQLGPSPGHSITLGNLAHVYWELGDLTRAKDTYIRAAAFDHEQGYQDLHMIRPGSLSEVHHALGETTVALDHASAAIGLARAIGDHVSEADFRRVLAHIRCDTGDLAAALDDARVAHRLTEDTGLARLEADTLDALATVQLRLGNGAEAADLHERALELSRRRQLCYPATVALLGLARAHVQLGDLDAAGRHAKSALALASEVGYRMLEGQALVELAEVRLRRGSPDDAAELAERASDIQHEIGYGLGEARARTVLAAATTS